MFPVFAHSDFFAKFANAWTLDPSTQQTLISTFAPANYDIRLKLENYSLWFCVNEQNIIDLPINQSGNSFIVMMGNECDILYPIDGTASNHPIAVRNIDVFFKDVSMKLRDSGNKYI